MGEHAAVYGEPALVAAVGRTLTATFEPATLKTGAETGSSGAAASAEPSVELSIPALDLHRRRPWREVTDYARAAAGAWERWSQDPSPESFRHVLGDDPGHVAWVALGTAALEVEELPASLQVRVESQLPIGSGFGSSAAAAVALVAGALAAWDREVPLQRLEELALDVERRQHGRPSGVDTGTVLRGEVLWAQRREGKLQLERLRRPATAQDPLRRIAVCDSGPPVEATGTVVAAVRRLRDQDPEAFAQRLTKMSQQTHRLREALTSEDTTSEDTPAATDLRPLFQLFQSELENLRVVPSATQQKIRRVEAQGGAAKISGAGCLRGPGAGSVLVYHPRSDPAELARHAGLEPLDMALGAPGLQIIPT